MLVMDTRKTLMALVLLLGFCAHAVADEEFERIIVFGDSLSDPGNAFILTGEQSLPPYTLIPSAAYAIGGHRFSNGKTWVEVFAHELGGQAKPAFRFNGDTNFAVGGSRARAVGNIHLSTQVSSYLNFFTDERDEDLIIILIGGNDIRDALVALATDPTGQTSSAILQAALTSINDNMLALIQSGVRQFLIASVPDVSLTPAVRLQGPQARFAANLFSVQFNQGLAQITVGLKKVFPISVVEFDLFTTFSSIAANEEKLKLDVVDTSCISPGVIMNAVCAKPDKYLFWDGIHPTKRVHKFIGKYASEWYGYDD